jgi:hypothetical protein
MHLIQFAEQGHRVFLVHHMERSYGGRATCGCGKPKCTAPGKHPRLDNWQRTPEWDEDQLASLQMQVDLGTGYGVICDNLLVIDVDIRNGGGPSWAKLCEDFPSVTSAAFIVETGRGDGSKHHYFSLPHDIRIAQKSADYPGIDFKHSGFVVGPGSPHESGKNYTVLYGSIDEIDAAPADLVEFLKKRVTTVEYNGSQVDVSEHALRSMLDILDCYDDYEDWVNVGMALHHATHGNGVDLWREWSSRSQKFDDAGIDSRWHGFGKSSNPITVGTLIKKAKDAGWIEPVSDEETQLQGWFAHAVTGNPVTQSVTQEDIKETASPIKGCPVDVSRVDLTSPPGFVGDVTRWINSQCLYPRENMAALAGLFAVGNAAGLRYMEDGPHKTRSNLAVFCVAGSGTGKDAVLNAVRKIHYVGGLGPATHGSIKSDREMYGNLIQHQAAIYTIDEIGGRLAKIANSRKGGATHLDGVMETFMDVYTKSNDSILLSGDMKKEVDKFLRERYAELKRGIEENEDTYGAMAAECESLEARMAMDGKIDFPFLSMIGFTTPRQFANMMTVENIETGFLGRTIMTVEHDDNPKPKDGFTRPDMAFGMETKIKQLANGKSVDQQSFRRVENLGSIERIGHTKAAAELLKACQEWNWKYTQFQIETTGHAFVGLYRRLYEKVVKIALILGLADGEIDVEHVEWAMAASLRDIHEKVSSVTTNDESFSKGDRLASAIVAAVKSKPGASMAVILNRSTIRGKFNKEDVEKLVEKLASVGQIRKEDATHKQSGQPLPKFYPV